MLRRVALVRTDFSEELSASFIREKRIGELATTLAVTSNRRTLRRNIYIYIYISRFRNVSILNAVFSLMVIMMMSKLKSRCFQQNLSNFMINLPLLHMTNLSRYPCYYCEVYFQYQTAHADSFCCMEESSDLRVLRDNNWIPPPNCRVISL
jgi:hypothetical protein